MKSQFLAALMVFGLGFLGACERPTYSGSEPPAIVAEALVTAKANGKPILFDLTAEW